MVSPENKQNDMVLLGTTPQRKLTVFYVICKVLGLGIGVQAAFANKFAFVIFAEEPIPVFDPHVVFLVHKHRSVCFVFSSGDVNRRDLLA